jgi:uncharacterized protein (TIGR02996 family)
MTPGRLPAIHQALLRAIVEQPGDDIARMAYADWLDENGDAEQAAFIRASLELHAMRPDDPRRADLAPELRQIGEARGKDWLAALGVASADELEPKFHRGCVEGIECQSLQPLFEAEQILFSLLPVRELLFWWQYSWGLDAAGLERLAAMPGLDRLRKLRLANYDTELMRADNAAEAWAEFFRCERLSGLRFLGIDATELTDADVEGLADAPSLAGLTTLSLEQNRIGIEGVWAILRSPHLKGLRRLSLGGNLDDADLDGEYDLMEELERRFPGQAPLKLFIETGWFRE